MGQHFYSHFGIIYIPGRKLEIEWIAQSIYDRMDFSRFTTPARADKLVAFAIYSPFLAPALCWCAFMPVESNDRFSMSASVFRAWKMR